MTVNYHEILIITTKKSCTVHLKLQANQKQKKKTKNKNKRIKPNPPFLKFECNYMNKGVVIIGHCQLTIPHANKLDEDKFTYL